MVSVRPDLPRRFLSVAILSLVALAGLSGQTASRPVIDLTALECFIRPGFSLDWTYYGPSTDDPDWIRVAPNAGNRPVVPRDLPLPGKSERGRLAVSAAKAERYTIVTAFDADASLTSSARSIGLYFQDIGKNWEVYLNGSVIASEVYLSPSGVISRERAVHGALVNVDKRFLKEGRNILAIVVIGDTADVRTGLFSGSPYLFGDYLSLLSMKSEYLDLMLIGVYFFFALYHIILFALRPDNRPYLFYGLGTLTFALYLFSRSYMVFDLIPDTAFIRGIELASLFLFFPLFLAFFDETNRGKVSLFTWIFGGLSCAFAFVAPVFWGEFLLGLWQKVLLLPLLYLLVFDFVLPTIKAFRETSALPAGGRAGALVRRPEFPTLVIAFLIVVLLVAAAAASLNSTRAFALAKIGAFFIIFGSATVLAGRLTGIFRDVEGLTRDLELRVRDRTAVLEKTMAEQASLNEDLAAASGELEKATGMAERDMRVAVQIQQGIFPQRQPETLDWELAFIYRPVKDVSGDFYDFYEESGRLVGAVMGDVSGHGISSGLITVLARSIFFRSFRSSGAWSLGRILEGINGELTAELAAVENYLTAAMLRIDGNSVEYANAAHTDLAFRRAGKPRASFVVPEVEGGFKGPPLGREGIEAPYRSVKFQVASGDSLLLYTDCLKDAPDREGRPFGPEAILSAYGRAPADSAQDMLEYIVEEWEFHRGETPQPDDLTAMLLKKK